MARARRDFAWNLSTGEKGPALVLTKLSPTSPAAQAGLTEIHVLLTEAFVDDMVAAAGEEIRAAQDRAQHRVDEQRRIARAEWEAEHAHWVRNLRYAEKALLEHNRTQP